MKILIVGTGQMGVMQMRSCLKSGHEVWGICKTAKTAEAVSDGIGCHVLKQGSPEIAQELKSTGCVFVCVKPWYVKEVCEELSGLGLPTGVPICSIAAGVTLSQISSSLPDSQPVIRAMPNTPCSVGHGMTVITRGEHATQDHVDLVQDLFSQVGQVLELEEGYFDAVTAVSASGVAFFYLVLEAMSDGGVMAGLPRSVALELTVAACDGAAAMVRARDEHPAALREAVTTPAGSTITGLLCLEDGKIRSSFARAVTTAAVRARELGSVKK